MVRVVDLMKKTSAFLEARINLLALAFCGSSLCFWMIIEAKRYYFSSFDDLDFTSFVQTLWSLTHGSFYNSVFGTNIFVEHCSFLCFLFAPFYWISPDPLLLQYFKIAAFFIGVYVFFLILKKRLNPWIALGAMVAFSVAPANAGMLQFPFNYEPFSIPLVLLIFKAFDDKKYVLYIVSCFILAMVKEQMPLVVMMFGVFAFIFRKEERLKWALVPFLMGLTIFIAEVFVFIPYIRKDLPIKQVYYWTRYTQFGRSPQEILSFLFFHPLTVLQECISPVNIRWYNDLFGIWGSLCFLSPQMLLPALLIFIKTLISNASFEKQVFTNYYASTFTPFIFLAAWNTLSHFQSKWRVQVHGLVIFIMLIHAAFFMPYWSIAPRHYPVGQTPYTLIAQSFIKQIPPQASVLSADSLLLPLANRQKVYPFLLYLKGTYDVSGVKFNLPLDTDYLLLNFADEYSLLKSDSKPMISKITKLNFSNNWKLQGSIEDIAFYVRDASKNPRPRLIEIDNKPFIEEKLQPVDLDGVISLQGFEFPKEFNRKYRVFPVITYWKSLRATEGLYGIQLRVRSKDGKLIYEKLKLIGSAIYPTFLWRKGEYIKEMYFYLLPRLSPGEYSMEIRCCDQLIKKWGNSIEERFMVQ